MSQIEQFSKEVLSELKALKDIGVQVPEGAFERAQKLDRLAEFQSMKVSECADLLVQLAYLE